MQEKVEREDQCMLRHTIRWWRCNASQVTVIRFAFVLGWQVQVGWRKKSCKKRSGFCWGWIGKCKRKIGGGIWRCVLGLMLGREKKRFEGEDGKWRCKLKSVVRERYKMMEVNNQRWRWKLGYYEEKARSRWNLKMNDGGRRCCHGCCEGEKEKDGRWKINV